MYPQKIKQIKDYSQQYQAQKRQNQELFRRLKELVEIVNYGIVSYDCMMENTEDSPSINKELIAIDFLAAKNCITRDWDRVDTENYSQMAQIRPVVGPEFQVERSVPVPAHHEIRPIMPTSMNFPPKLEMIPPHLNPTQVPIQIMQNPNLPDQPPAHLMQMPAPENFQEMMNYEPQFAAQDQENSMVVHHHELQEVQGVSLPPIQQMVMEPGMENGHLVASGMVEGEGASFGGKMVAVAEAVTADSGNFNENSTREGE